MTKVTEDQEPTNPLQKLMEGFCSPLKMSKRSATSYDEDDEANAKYAPDLTPQEPKEENQEPISDASPEPEEIKEEQDKSKASPKLTTDESEPLTKGKTADEDSTEGKNANGDSAEDQTVDDKIDADDEAKSELEISQKMIENRQKSGAQNFIMACIFLFSTLFALKKFGYTTSDFDFSVASGGGNGSSPSPIHVFEKSSVVEEEKIKVRATTKEESVDDSSSEEAINEL